MRFSPFLAAFLAACATGTGDNTGSWESVGDVNEQTNNTVDPDAIGLEASPARVSFESSCRAAVDITRAGDVHGAAAIDALLAQVEANGGDAAALRALQAAKGQAIADRYPQLQNAASQGDLPGFSCPDLQMVLEERL